MRSVAAGAVVGAALLLAGCPSKETIDCGDGFLCPVGKVCAEQGHCGEPAAVEACLDLGKHQFDACQVGATGGTCLEGVCSKCNADLAGCEKSTWEAMTSPTTPKDLLSVFALPVPDGQPMIAAYAGGLDGILLAYDGRTWTRVADFPATMASVKSIWASAPDDLYVVTSNHQLSHFDGTTWSTLTLPTDLAANIQAITGVAANDIYAVGFAGVVAHYDRSTWSVLRTPPGPNLVAVASITPPPDALAIAVGGGGYVVEISQAQTTTTSQPLPTMPVDYHSADLNALAVDGSKLVAVGAPAGVSPTLMERPFTGQQWTNFAPTSVGSIPFTAAWSGFVGGRDGTILHDDGASWSELPTPGSNTVESISGAGGVVLAVGDGGVIWRYRER